MKAKKGDRIRLTSMTNDPAPIEPGAIGTVIAVASFDRGPNAWNQIHVEWDNGRTLMLVVPPDEFEVLASLGSEQGES